MSRLLLHNDLTVNSDRKDVEKFKKASVKLLTNVISIVLILTVVFLVFPMCISENEDMYPFLKEGDILVSFRFDTEYQINDVVFFKDENGNHVGRIAAKEGDTVEINGDEKLYVNSYPQSEEVFYPTLPEEGDLISLTVPDNSYYLLSDYRLNISDSRAYGFVPEEKLSGRVFMVIRRRNI